MLLGSMFDCRCQTRARGSPEWCGQTAHCCGCIFGKASLVQQERHRIETEPCDERILENDGHDFAFLYRLAVSQARAGQLEEAARVLGRAAEANQGSAEARALLGVVLAALGRLDEAVANFKAALIINPRSPQTHTKLGNVLQVLRRPAEAVPHYECALAGHESAVAHTNLGNALQLVGRLDDAQRHYERALALDPSRPESHNNLAVLLAARNCPDMAIAHYEVALVLKPDYYEALNNLGNALQSLGRDAEAIRQYELAVSLRPDHVEARSNLGNVLAALKRPFDAIEQYKKALAIRPDYAEIHNNLGNALSAVGRDDDAIAQYQQAVALRPAYGSPHNNLGTAFLARRCPEEAVTHYRKALACEPDNADVHNNLGVALNTLGEFAQASQAFARAVSLAPRKAEFYLNLLGSKRITADDPHLIAMLELYRDVASLGVQCQIALQFALGRAFEDLGEHERSFRHLSMGNALKRRELIYDEAAALQLFERTRATFTSELMFDKRGAGDPSRVPVFILGMPRSGSTLVEQILASHSQVFGAGELHDFHDVVDVIARTNNWSYPEMVAQMSGEQLRQIGTRYVGSISACAPTVARIVNKMPANFGSVGLIHLALPNARIIHTTRDPLDTCLSCFSLLFAGGHPYSYDLAELGRYYRSYHALMQHWRSLLPPHVMLEVRYEDVVTDLEGQARAMVTHCGLEWEESCLAFHKTKRPVQTASMVQVRQPIYRTSIGRWQRYKDLLQPLVQALGAKLTHDAGAPGATGIKRVPQR
jgi:tetratricopeptide (TPR) repeat protein